MLKLRNILYIIGVIALLSSCARMGRPDGGWYNETPPHVIGSTPADRSTNVQAKKVNIYFDEFIKLDNASEKVVVSPPQLEQAAPNREEHHGTEGRTRHHAHGTHREGEARRGDAAEGVTRRRMVVTIVCLLLIVSAIFVGYRFYRYLATRTIRVRKEELKKRLAGIESVSNLFSDDYKSTILALYKDIAEIGLGKHHSWKANNEKIAAISDTLMRMNRSNVFMLLKKIDQQRERLASLEIADSKLLADNSQRALSNGDIEELRSQALANEQWLSAYEKVQKELSGYMFQLRDVIIIKGLSDGILTEIDEYKQLLTTDPMESLDGKLQEIRRRYNRLFLDDALQTLRAYFASRSKRLDALDANDHVVEAVRMQLDSVTSDMQQQDRLTLLRQLKHTDRRIEQVVLRSRLQKEMDRYTFIRRTAISENEERVVQVDEKRLECEIATRSDETTHNISLLIADIYACMSDTDPRLVNSILKFNGFDNQQAKVLMLLIADAKVKRTAVPGMLRVVGNLNPVISRLLKNKIKPSEDEIRQYVERHPASLASYILKLIE